MVFLCQHISFPLYLLVQLFSFHLIGPTLLHISSSKPAAGPHAASKRDFPPVQSSKSCSICHPTSEPAVLPVERWCFQTDSYFLAQSCSCDSLRCSWHSSVLGHTMTSLSSPWTGTCSLCTSQKGYFLPTGFTPLPDFTYRPDILTFWPS